MNQPPYPLTIADPAGRPMLWHLHSVKFESPDGVFEFHIYAISEDHAKLQVQAIRETAEYSGRTLGIFRA